MVMTTNVTHRRPHRMPWAHRDLYYDPARLRRLFPERIVAWMDAHPPPPGEGRERERRERRLAALAPLRPFPSADDLPVVVAARMSLSFPLLISAVPLHALDMTRRRTRRAVEAVETGSEPDRAARRRGLLVLGRRDREQLPRPLLRHAAPDQADVRDRPRRVPPRSRPPPGRGRQRLPAVDERRWAARDVAPARPGAGLREPQRVRQRDRPHDAEPRRLGAHAAAGLPGPDRARPHRAGRGRDEPDDAAARDRGAHPARPGGRAQARRALRGDAGHRRAGSRGTTTAGCATGARLPPSASCSRSSAPPGARRRPASGGTGSSLERADDEGPAGYRFTSEAQQQLALALTELLAEAGERAAAGPASVTRGAPRPEPVARIVPGD